ncbi:photosynthetic complex assembly protein PuhC [Pelagibius sp.]|uniref:photosynthetic complex assembly protein PuhC n=1 Tax=Pelagibius sp. TaxID=1931238 RepID=UPI0026340B25|nr:photosynthetic complex assembly protein PuhC [Pelagibius sp.]
MTTNHKQTETIPRPVLLAAGAMVILAIALAGFGQTSGIGRVSLPEAEAVASRDLRFEQRSDGQVVVLDSNGIAAINPKGAGFLLGIARGLGRERLLRGGDPNAPFTLTRWSDGRLSLLDRETGSEIELSAFGPDNRRLLATLLYAETVAQ